MPRAVGIEVVVAILLSGWKRGSAGPKPHGGQLVPMHVQIKFQRKILQNNYGKVK